MSDGVNDGDGYILNEDEVQQALGNISRGDGFDMGGERGEGGQAGSFLDILSNPTQLASSLNLSHKQAENIRALLTGGGAGLASKYLAKTFGDEIAGAIGGFIGGYLSKRVIK